MELNKTIEGHEENCTTQEPYPYQQYLWSYYPFSFLQCIVCQEHICESIQGNKIDLFHIVSAHACIGHVTRYFSIIGETLHRWGKRIFCHWHFFSVISDNKLF